MLLDFQLVGVTLKFTSFRIKSIESFVIPEMIPWRGIKVMLIFGKISGSAASFRGEAQGTTQSQSTSLSWIWLRCASSNIRFCNVCKASNTEYFARSLTNMRRRKSIRPRERREKLYRECKRFSFMKFWTQTWVCPKHTLNTTNTKQCEEWLSCTWTSTSPV